ncbi:pyrimidine-nucleoside phosphorylase [Anoxynatronum buryatiense]|uniref:Pyrimidine-nucleoside phosphorylase n=1 Tax=Anoxynatronum buryatiense TaxID=489973 RepID=A0AA46AIA5_9CLOT|nr:pyrimidine-nucleoside phosphorylase [Anoxynatronum buryatiense]SMP48309.1 thymidine phosphorylase [Anoxynatronum buryatiense]
MRMLDLILKKKNGGTLSKAEIQFFIQGVTHDTIPDYQTAAFLMAVCFQGMTPQETSALTEAMMYSGDTIDLSEIHGVKVDKHSTGGVGDKTTIALGPMVAACGIPVAKMSGRGLGHTGGTIDKLESFKGFQTALPIRQFMNQVNEIKLAVAGQTANLAPADKKLYALRDVTGTVENVSLIASSVMSKKLASGADAIVLDVKTGSGAFMKTKEEAVNLARTMVEIGKHMGRKTVALVTDMDQPLGKSVGNILEVKEAIDVLKGQGPKDITELCIQLGAWMLVLGECAADLDEGKAAMKKSITSGSALESMRQFIASQGGDPRYVDDPSLFDSASYLIEVTSPGSGIVTHIDAEGIGRAALVLGAGREQKDSQIDLAVGIVLNKKVGDEVALGESIATLHVNDLSKVEESELILLASYLIGEQAPEPNPLIYAVIQA